MHCARLSDISLHTPIRISQRLKHYSENMPGLNYPPFPDNVPTHTLLDVDFALLKAGNEEVL